MDNEPLEGVIEPVYNNNSMNTFEKIPHPMKAGLMDFDPTCPGCGPEHPLYFNQEDSIYAGPLGFCKECKAEFQMDYDDMYCPETNEETPLFFVEGTF